MLVAGITINTQERQTDLKKILSSIISEAFFRKTSKLGLKFAREQNIKIAFVWNHLFSESLPSSLQEFRDYIEQKPYYSFDFRENSNNAKYPEAITCSEARYLGCLKKGREIDAPDFLLIRDIQND